jgi:cytochrome c5
MLFFKSHEGEYQYDNTQTKQWNRGAYLVNGLGHCGMCHTPLNALGAPKWKYFLTGAFIDNYWAPNISASGLASSTVDQTVSVFSQDRLVNNAGQVVGPMAEVNHNSLNKLTTDDLQAIVVYLKTVKSHEPMGIKPARMPNMALSYTRGKHVYDKACVVCHQEGILGAPVIGDKKNWTQRALKGNAVLYKNAIDGFNQMPYRGGCMTCTDDDIKAGVDYLLHTSTNRTYATVQNAPKAAKKSGKAIYEQTCAMCHDKGGGGAIRLGDKTVWAPIIAQNFDVTVGVVVKGKGNMPPKGGCVECTTGDIIAATQYMLQQGEEKGSRRNFSLW